jgi:hypothetical protein
MSTNEPGRKARMGPISTVKPPLTLPEMMTLNDFAVRSKIFSRTRPGFGALGLLAGQHRVTHAVVQRVNHHIHRIAHCYFKFATIVQELFAGNYTFRLEAGVYSNPIIIDGYHGTADYGSPFDVQTF